MNYYSHKARHFLILLSGLLGLIRPSNVEKLCMTGSASHLNELFAQILRSS